MLRKGRSFCLLLVGLLAGVAPAQAQRPGVFVFGKEGAWWMNQAIFKLDATSAHGVTVKTLNQFMANKAGWANICYLQSVDRESTYIGLFRGLDKEIQDWLKSKPSDPFHSTFSGGSDKTFSADIVAYEKCDGDFGFGALITDHQRVREFQYYDSNEKGTNSQLLWIRNYDKENIAIAGCDECGDLNVLRYDVKADRFYWEYKGD